MKKSSSKDDGMKVEDLVKVLNKIRSAVSPRGIVPQSDHFLFLGDGLVGANNDQICAVIDLPPGFPDVRGSVDAGIFYRFLSTFPQQGVLNISVDKDQRLRVKSGNRSFGLPLTPWGQVHDAVKSTVPSKKEKFESFDPSLRESIVLCSFYASKNMSEAHMIGVWVDESDVMSTDAYRVAWAKREDKGKSCFFIPASSAVLLKDYPELDEVLVDSSGWIHFRGGSLIWSSRSVEAEFRVVKAKALFPKIEKKNKSIEIPSSLTEALDRALILLEDVLLLDKEVYLDFSGKEVKCYITDQNRGWFSETVKLKEEVKKDFSMKVNPIFMKEVLKHTTEMILVEAERALFISENFRCLLALSGVEG